MAMDTRTTNQLGMYATTLCFITPATTLVRPVQPYFNYTIRPEFGTSGTYKQVTSERSGKFFPGKFRANPCILKENKVESIKGYARSRAYLGNCVELLGDFWNLQVIGNSSLWSGEYNSGYGAWNQGYADYAKVKALSKLKEAEFDAAVALAELKETLTLLRNPISALTDELKKIGKDKQFKKGKSFLNVLAGGWLTYRYGIIPLMSDITAIIQLCESKIRKIEGMQRKAGGFETSSKWDLKGDHLVSLGEPSFGLTTMYQFERKYKTTHHCYYFRDFEGIEMVQLRALGIHPTQITSFVWEKTRLSFVLDWFVAVGDWLRAFTPDPAISFAGHCVSQKIETTIQATTTRVSCGVGLDPTVPVVLPKVLAVSRYLERRVATTEVVFPPLNPNFFSIKRLLDSFALAWALLPIRK
nr:MAG: maturation protein [Leviviridae sp.]